MVSWRHYYYLPEHVWHKLKSFPRILFMSHNLAGTYLVLKKAQNAGTPLLTTIVQISQLLWELGHNIQNNLLTESN